MPLNDTVLIVVLGDGRRCWLRQVSYVKRSRSVSLYLPTNARW